MRTDIVSFLVLTYRKPAETEACLKSIRARAKLPHQIILLDNGVGAIGDDSLFNLGLCDVYIAKSIGRGGGVGQTDLFRYCDTQYAYFIQSDQILIRDLSPYIHSQFVKALQSDYRCIDLNGDQSNRGVWTDRAHLIDVAFFNALAPFPNGGPGPLHELRWNENYLQEVFSRPENKIAHANPLFFADNGRTTVRELPDGSVVKMETDTKAVTWISLPKQPYVFPEMTETEWGLSIAGGWIGGTVPETYLKRGDSFKHWRQDT